MDLFLVFFSIFCAGVVSLILELSLLREFVYIFGSTAASNAYIISIFLLGLVAGSYLGTWQPLCCRDENQARQRFVLIQLVSVFFIALFFATKKYIIYDITSHQIVRVYFFLSVLTPSLLSGLAYSLSVKIMHWRGEKAITYIYAISTLGSVVGGLGHGLILVPLYGMTSTYAVAAFFAFLALVFMASRLKAYQWAAVILIVTAVFAFMYFQPSRTLFAKPYVSFSEDSEFGVVELWRMTEQQAQLHNLRIGGREEELTPGKTYYDFKVNNIHQSYSFPVDYRIHSQWTLTSLEIVGHPANVLLFGYGSGVTAAGYLRSPRTRRLDIVENCEPIIRAGKKIFPDEYDLVSRDPRCRMIVDDFRGHIRFTEEKYDVVAIDHSLVDPYQSGFFTTDFFDLVKRKMNPGGVVVLLGGGLSWNTTKSSFRYIYKNINPSTEPLIRENCLFMSDRPFSDAVAKDYRSIDDPLVKGGLVYTDQTVKRFF